MIKKKDHNVAVRNVMVFSVLYMKKRDIFSIIYRKNKTG